MNTKYQKTLKIIIEKVVQERQSSIEIINLKLIELYWEIGNMLLTIKEEENFGNDIIKKIIHRFIKKISRYERLFSKKYKIYDKICKNI